MRKNPESQNKRKITSIPQIAQDSPLVHRLRMMNGTDDEFFDPTDDMFDDEVEDPGHHLKTNEEIFTDEYMQDFAEKMDAKIAHEKQQNKFISVGVILGCILLIGIFCIYACCRYL